MQIKTMIRFYFIFTRTAYNNKKKVGKSVEKVEPSHTGMGTEML